MSVVLCEDGVCRGYLGRYEEEAEAEFREGGDPCECERDGGEHGFGRACEGFSAQGMKSRDGAAWS